MLMGEITSQHTHKKNILQDDRITNAYLTQILVGQSIVQTQNILTIGKIIKTPPYIRPGILAKDQSGLIKANINYITIDL